MKLNSDSRIGNLSGVSDSRFLLPLVTAGIVAMPSLQAQTTWQGGTSTDWADAANWDNGVPNGGNGDILVQPGTSFEPTFSTGSLDTIVSLFTGAFTTSNSQLNVTGGSLITGQHVVSPDGGTTGNVVTISDAGALIGSKYWFIVGRNGGNGTFTLTDGTVNAATRYDHAVLGNTAGSVGTVNVDGGFLNVGGDGGERQPAAEAELWVGEGGSGTVNQSAGEVNSRAYFVIGRNGGSDGTYNQTGGTVNAATTQGFAVVGSFGGATGELNVGGDFNAPRGLFAGEGGQATVNVNNGGTLDVTGPINGGGTIGMEIAFAGNNATDASSTVTVNTGGTLYVENDLRMGFAGNASSTALLDIDGGTFNFASTNERWLQMSEYDFGDSTLVIQNGGTLNLNAGADLRMGMQGNDGIRTVTVDGVGSQLLGTPAANADASNFEIGRASAASDNILNIQNGGLVQMNAIYTNANTDSAIINFDDGTLKAVASDGNWINLGGAGTREVNVLANGAVFDTNGFDCTIHNPLLEGTTTGGGITKIGGGNLTLLGAGTITGDTLVSEGTLTLDGGSLNLSTGIEVNNTGAGAKLVLANNGAITTPVTITSGALDADGTIDTLIVADDVNNMLTTGNGADFPLYGTDFTFQGAATLDVQMDGLNEERYFVCDNLVTNAGATDKIIINAVNTAGFWKGSGQQYIVVDYSGGGYTGDISHFEIGTLDPPLNPSIQTATLVDTGFEIVIEIAGDPLGWTGDESNAWTTNSVGGSQNWTFGGSGSEFSTDDAVLFDDFASLFNVDITDADVNPSAVVFENTFGTDYTISSSGGYGIASGALIMNGDGKVTLSTDNSYTGATSINFGTLEILGTGSIADSSSINIGADGELILNLSGADEYPNPITGSGNVTNQGAATLTLSGASTFTGDFIQDAGQLNLNSAGALGAGPGSFIINGGVLDNTSGGTLNLAPDKPVTLNTNLSFIGSNDLYLSNGVVTLTDSRTVEVQAGTLGMGAPVDLAAGYDLVKTGVGTLVLNGGNIAGNLDVQAGIVGVNQDFFGAAPVGTGILQNAGQVGTKWTFWDGNGDVTSALQIQDNPTPTLGQLGIVKRGTGSLTLTNAANNTTAQLNVDSGTLIVEAGTYKRQAGDGSTLITPDIGGVGWDAAENGRLVIDGASVDYNCATSAGLEPWSGSFSIGLNATGAGAAQLHDGSLDVFRQLAVGRASGAFGGFSQTGGTTTVGGFLGVGLDDATGIVNLSSGTFNHAGPISCGGGAGGTGVINISGTAAYNNTHDKPYALWIGENGDGTLNVMDTAALSFTGSTTTRIEVARNAGSQGKVNLMGGSITGTGLVGLGGDASLTLNGGSLVANGATATFLDNFDSAIVHSGGGTIDNGGFNITIPQALTGPVVGNGVSATGLTVSGGGFIDTPIVSVAGGDGTGASAIATIDANGDLTGIVITNPGSGYTVAPTFTLIGGGIANTGSIGGAATLVPSASGSIALQGAGTTTMSGINTYKGDTSVASGTSLFLTNTGALTFAPEADTVTNQLTGAGSAAIDGGFILDLSNADLTDGNSWTIEDLGSATYHPVTFSVTSNLGAFSQAADVWTLTDGGGNTWTFTEATGVLAVTVPSGSPFADWSVLDGATGVTFEGDENGDGVPDGLAFLLGAANPNVDANGLLPTTSEDGSGGLVMTFTMLDSASRGTAALSVQHSSDLGASDAWGPVAPDPLALVPDSTSTVGGVDFEVSGSGTLTVIATIPAAGNASGGRLFGRLSGTE